MHGGVHLKARPFRQQCAALVLLVLAVIAPTAPVRGQGGSSAALDKLFIDLKAASSEPTALAIEQSIWLAWLQSGDAEVDKLTQQAIASMQARKFEDALAILDAVVLKAPGFAEGWNKRATVLYIVGEHDRSLADINKVLALEPRHFGALSGIGLIKVAIGDKAAALAAYRKVLDIYPLSGGARLSVEQLSKELEGDPT